jgi:hypothetical protein
MTKITFPDKIEFTGPRYGLVFLKGVTETDNQFMIDHLRSKGFIIEEDNNKPLTPTPQSSKPVELKDMKNDQLVEMAKEYGLDFKVRDKKEKIVEAIEAAKAEKEKAVEEAKKLESLKVEAEKLEIAIPEDATVEMIEALINAKNDEQK